MAKGKVGTITVPSNMTVEQRIGRVFAHADSLAWEGDLTGLDRQEILQEVKSDLAIVSQQIRNLKRVAGVNR